MEILLALSVIFGLGFFMGWRMREQTALRHLDKMADEIANDALEEFKSKVIDITVEDHDGVFYIYKREDGSYLAHGPSMEKLEDILMDKFPGKLFNAKPDDLEKLKTR